MALKLLIAAGYSVAAILRAIGNALYEPDDGERVPTWSVRKRDARIFFLLLYGLWIMAAAILAHSQYASAPLSVIQWATPPPHIGDGSAYAVIQRFGNLVVPLLAVALVLTPILTAVGRILMSISQFIDKKILDPIVDAHIARRTAERGRPFGVGGTSEAVIARMNERWASWVTRRDEALAQGREFNEPRPDEVETPLP